MNKWAHGILAAALAAPAFGQSVDVQAAMEKARTALERSQERLAGVDVELLAQASRLKTDELRAQIDHVTRMDVAGALTAARSLTSGMTFQYQKSNGSYDGGTRALDDHRYEDAIRNFDVVINTRGARADGAMYWKAYALDRAGRRDEAVATIAKLRQDYPQSRWLNDAQALEAAAKQGSGQPAAGASDTEDLKLMAINSLMNADPDRAIPLLENVLKGNSAPRVKERALFVLTQSKAPRASQLLSEYAKGAGNPDMQLRAVRYLGMSATPESQQQLVTIYGASADHNLKREIIRSLLMSRATDQIFAIAKTEKDPELRIEAIRQLGGLRATPQLMQLYSAETNADNKVVIVRSLMGSGSGDKLLELARTEKDLKVRTEAIRGIVHNASVPMESILQLYASETDLKMRREIVNGIISRGDTKTLVDLARKESDPAAKKMIVERISTSHSKEATEYMMELLK